MQEGSLFSTPSPAFIVCRLFDEGHSGWYEELSHCNFDLHLSNNETPVLWPPHAKSWLIGKDPDAGRDLGQEEKGTTEDEMARWHHRLDGHEFGWTPGVLQFIGSQRVRHDWTTELKWTEDECQGQCVNLCDTLCTLSSLSTLKRNNANGSDLYTRNYCTRSLPY